MSSIVSKILSLFSGKGGAESPVAAQTETYRDLVISANPQKDGAQYRIAGQIISGTGDAALVRDFIRADVFSSRDEAVEFTLRKGRQIIDQQGRDLFADGAPTGRA